MTDASIRLTRPVRSTSDRFLVAPKPIRLSRETVDVLVVMGGSALMALGGAMLASYLMLPFGG